METPYFQIDKNELLENIQTFKDALNIYWPNSTLAYSVKTNSLPYILGLMKQQGIKAEVVSDEEYELSRMCGYKEDRIIFNGPAKDDSLFLEAIEKGSIVNIDSQHELQVFNQNVKGYKPNMGIRINIDTALFNEKDIFYQDDGFRFGFSEENGELAEAVNTIRFNDPSNAIGIHFHCNSATRSIDVYEKIALYVRYIITKYDITASYIDIGGGFFGGVEGKPVAHDYISAVYHVLKDTVDIHSTKLIVEPGSALVASAVDFYTSVLDVKETHKSVIVTTDGSKINIDPLWSKKSFLHRIEKTGLENEKMIDKKQIICGYTCMEHDRIMALEKTHILSKGDKIVYEKTGAYSVTFGGPFIRYLPEVYVKNGNTMELIRKRMSVKDYYHIQT